jgi:hypothetical protein
MTILQRFRIWLAVRLCAGTSCLVVRDRPLLLLLQTAAKMGDYIIKSGALTATHSDRRLRAYKVLLRGSAAMLSFGREVMVGPFPAPPKPEPLATVSGTTPKEELHESQAA